MPVVRLVVILAGLLLLSAAPASATNNCCADNGSPGCNVDACEAAVCAADALCCSAAWDSLCAAAAIATHCVDICFASASTCCVHSGGMGCDDSTCEAAVCDQDSFCCDVEWDNLCAAAAPALCPGVCSSNCCEFRPGEFGCDMTACEAAVCADDPFCCGLEPGGEWDDVCQEEAWAQCKGLCAGRDDVLCYKVKESKLGDKFQKRTDDLDIGNGPVAHESKKPALLCNPAERDISGGAILDADEHLKAYVIKEAKGQPKHQPLFLLARNDVFGEVFLSTKKAAFLMVPTAKDLSAPPSDFPHNIDHFQCYSVKADKIGERNEEIEDQFESFRTVTIKKVSHLCLPVSKNGEPLINPIGGLLCGTAKPDRKHVKRISVHTKNQFGFEILDTSKEALFCSAAIVEAGF